MRIVTKSLVAVATVGAVVVAPITASAVGGLDGPLFGLDAAPNGDVLVADARSGITVIRNDRVRSSIALPGATAVSAIGTKSMWVTTSGEDPETDSGQALWRVSNGSARMVANLFELEESDPDGAGVDSNPYDVASLGGGAALVVDAGGNTLWRVDNQGNGELVATFPDEPLSTENFNEICFDLGEFGPPCPIPAPAIPGQAVPTSVAVGPDGACYVGERRGSPRPPTSPTSGASSPAPPDWNAASTRSAPRCSTAIHLHRRPRLRPGRHPVRVPSSTKPTGPPSRSSTTPLAARPTHRPRHAQLPGDRHRRTPAHRPHRRQEGHVYATVNGLTPGAGQVTAVP